MKKVLFTPVGIRYTKLLSLRITNRPKARERNKNKNKFRLIGGTGKKGKIISDDCFNDKKKNRDLTAIK